MAIPTRNDLTPPESSIETSMGLFSTPEKFTASLDEYITFDGDAERHRGLIAPKPLRTSYDGGLGLSVLALEKARVSTNQYEDL